MKHFENYNLRKHNTFAVDCFVKHFVCIENEDELHDLARSSLYNENKRLILGAGSNILFKSDFNGLVIIVGMDDILISSETEEYIFVTAGAGAKWHNLVEFALSNKAYGLENLALIPGTVGAAPVQNIGAYGAEQKDFFYELKGYNLETNKFEILNYDDCYFGYRNSVFKNELRDKFIVTSVTYKLNKTPALDYSYKDLQNEFTRNNNASPTPEDVFNAVCKVRQQKLPDYEILGNAGSFFKNPVVSKSKLDSLLAEYPDMVNYKLSETEYKLSAGWLIERSGWKGKIFGNAGVYDRHALILVNLNNASGEEIYELSELIIIDVQSKFDVILEREVIII